MRALGNRLVARASALGTSLGNPGTPAQHKFLERYGVGGRKKRLLELVKGEARAILTEGLLHRRIGVLIEKDWISKDQSLTAKIPRLSRSSRMRHHARCWV